MWINCPMLRLRVSTWICATQIKLEKNRRWRWRWLHKVHIERHFIHESLVSPGLQPMVSGIQRPWILRSSRPDWERKTLCQSFPYHIYQVREVAEGNCPGRRVVGDSSLQFLLVGSFPKNNNVLKEPGARDFWLWTYGSNLPKQSIQMFWSPTSLAAGEARCWVKVYQMQVNATI